MKFCVLMPAHNEAKTIRQVVISVKNKNLDIIVVDDHSSDGTADLAQEAGAFVIRRQSSVRGKGAALKDGFSYILKQQYDGIILMDSDGQHDCEDLEKFMSLAQEHPDSIIVGNRMGNAEKMPMVRYLTNKFMSWLISLGCHQKIEDSQCGYRYLGINVLKQIQLTTGSFEIETEILMKASKKKIPIFSVPIKTIYEDEESKINPIKDTIRFFQYFIKEIFNP